jgi:hypothetical protein
VAELSGMSTKNSFTNMNGNEGSRLTRKQQKKQAAQDMVVRLYTAIKI